MRIALLAVLALVGAAPAVAQTPGTTAGSWRDMIQQLRGTGRAKPVRVARAPAPALIASIVDESEPNDSVRTADSIALGDRATGVIDPAGDVDTWFVDLTAGQFFGVDVDAQVLGSPLDAQLVLLAPDGHTVVAFSDDFDGFDSRISFHVAQSGRYYVLISSFGRLGGSPDSRYALNFGLVTCDAVGAEQEPNDAPANATPIAIGDSVTGELCAHDQNPRGDLDYWAFAAQAGTTVDLDVDAGQGLFGDAVLELFGPGGTTRLTFNDNQDFADPRLQFSVTTTGTYFAAVSAHPDFAGNPFPYTLHLTQITPGPGDPITVRADSLGLPLGLAVGSTGDLFVGDLNGRILRVSSQGAVTTFVPAIELPLQLAFDAFGNLLVTTLINGVYRITPQGQATRFITDIAFPFGIAVAPDGRIWVTDVDNRALRRYSATGEFEASFPVGSQGSGPGPLAFGPSGEPYFSTGTEIWKLVNGQPQRVFGNDLLITGFAFDVAGNVYAATPVAGQVLLFDPTGTVLAAPFAIGPDAPRDVAFGRDAAGRTVARLFATDFVIGRIIEMNSAGIALPGLPGFMPAPFPPDVAAAALLGGGGLRTEDLQYLDAVGNHNGRYDVGDLQAYLRVVAAQAAPARSNR